MFGIFVITISIKTRHSFLQARPISGILGNFGLARSVSKQVNDACAPGKHHVLSAMVHQDQRRHLNAMLLIFSLFFQTHASAQYTDPLFQTALFFGLHSQWIQPWRGYLETVPASRFLNGIGVVLNSPNPDLVCQMLSRHGIAITRIEIGWGNVTLGNAITNPHAIAALQACQKWG